MKEGRVMRPDGTQTRVVGLFGDPVAHSLSPRMQNAAFRARGLNLCYLSFHVTSARLWEAVAAVRALGFVGVNITIPHKVAAMELVDEVSEEARRVGAINTVVNRDGRLVGFNTDVAGVVDALKEGLGQDIKGKNVVLVGAGGAARACAHAFAQGGAGRLAILNRSAGRAEELAGELGAHAPQTRVFAGPLCPEEIKKWAMEADLFVNATSLGLENAAETPLEDPSLLPTGCAVCDLVYRTGGTRLIRTAKSRGLRTLDGLSVLLYQGARAFTLWTGEEAPIGAMKASLKTVYRG